MTTTDRQLWAEPQQPQQPSLETLRQCIQQDAGAGAHTAHIAAVRLEWAQSK